MTSERLIVNKAGWKRLTKGHPWVFSDDLAALPGVGAGEVLALYDSFGRFMGHGFYNPESRIAFRLITREDVLVDEAFWRKRLQAAIDYRDSLTIDGTARRLVFSEADGFPGMIVDQYDDCLSMQIMSLGMETIRDLVIDLLKERFAPRAIVMRNDSPVRTLEGLKEEKGVVHGALPDEIVIKEGNLGFRVNLLEGQKTGAYLDQRDNHLYMRQFVEGKRALDVFCYEGGFALHMKRAGAAEVVAIDSSRQALERVESNAELNGLGPVETRRNNGFDALKEIATRGEERFDVIVVDPPPFARRKSDLKNALRAYRELNLRAIQSLNPGGLLFTCCCSHGVSHDLFSETAAEAAGRARRDLILLDQRLQPPDHPIFFNEPESQYLKGFLFRCL